MAERMDVSFVSGDVTCAGYLYQRAAAIRKVPCVALAHRGTSLSAGYMVAVAEGRGQTGDADRTSRRPA